MDDLVTDFTEYKRTTQHLMKTSFTPNNFWKSAGLQCINQ